MPVQKRTVVLLIVTTLILNASVACASVLINEIFADPAMGLGGDSNFDGVRSGTQDEFVELMNFGLVEADISNWSLSDSIAARHIFPSNTVLAPKAFLVVFGGGSPALPGVNWQVASSGGLSLNNSSDTVLLADADHQAIDQVIYGRIADKDQSITRYPDGEGTEFVLHSELDQANGALFSPGFGLNPIIVEPIPEEADPISNPVVPELPTLIYFGMGWGTLFWSGWRRII